MARATPQRRHTGIDDWVDVDEHRSQKCSAKHVLQHHLKDLPVCALGLPHTRHGRSWVNQQEAQRSGPLLCAGGSQARQMRSNDPPHDVDAQRSSRSGVVGTPLQNEHGKAPCFSWHARHSPVARCPSVVHAGHHNCKLRRQWRHNGGAFASLMASQLGQVRKRAQGRQTPRTSSSRPLHRRHDCLRPDCFAAYSSGNFSL